MFCQPNNFSDRPHSPSGRNAPLSCATSADAIAIGRYKQLMQVARHARGRWLIYYQTHPLVASEN